MSIEIDKINDLMQDDTVFTRRTPSPFPNPESELDEFGRVFNSSEFRTAAITAAVGGVVAATSDSTVLKAAGVAALMYGGFKLIDAFLTDESNS